MDWYIFCLIYLHQRERKKKACVGVIDWLIEWLLLLNDLLICVDVVY